MGVQVYEGTVSGGLSPPITAGHSEDSCSFHNYDGSAYGTGFGNGIPTFNAMAIQSVIWEMNVSILNCFEDRKSVETVE